MSENPSLVSVTEDDIVSKSFVFSDVGENIVWLIVRRFDVERYSRRTGDVYGVGVSSFF
jgi:hypothetical protein